MTVYLDIIFLENLFMNYIILYATAIILKLPIKITRTILGSSLGSLYVIISYITNLEIFTSIILKIILSLAIIYVSYSPGTIKLLMKELLIFYLTSFTFGGVAFALLYFINPEKILYINGTFIGTYPIKIALAGGIIGFIITTIAFKNIKNRLNKNDMKCNLKIHIRNHFCFIKAIIDTGNFLRDPISKTPVVIIEKDSLQEVIPNYILKNTEKIINGENIDLHEFDSKIRIIPFNSLGMKNGILLGIKGDLLVINLEERNIYVKDFIIGLYNGNLSKAGKYHGLIGLDILEDRNIKTIR